MKKLFLFTVFAAAVCFVCKTQAQIYNASQLVKIHNASSINDLNLISNPNSGNLALVTSQNKIYKYDGANWKPVGGVSSAASSEGLIDSDEDTYVEVDNGFDNDRVGMFAKNKQITLFK